MMLNGTVPAEFDCLDMLNSTMLEVVNETLVSFCPEPNNHAKKTLQGIVLRARLF